MFFFNVKNSIYYFPIKQFKIKKKNIKFLIKTPLLQSFLFQFQLPMFLTLSNTFYKLSLVESNNFANLFYKLFYKVLVGYMKGYKIRLILQGRGLKAFYYKTFLILKLNFSNKVLFQLPQSVKVQIEQLKQLNFYSFDYFLLKSLVRQIYNLKPLNLYTLKGFLFNNKVKLVKKKKNLN